MNIQMNFSAINEWDRMQTDMSHLQQKLIALSWKKYLKIFIRAEWCFGVEGKMVWHFRFKAIFLKQPHLFPGSPEGLVCDSGKRWVWFKELQIGVVCACVNSESAFSPSCLKRCPALPFIALRADPLCFKSIQKQADSFRGIQSKV